MMDEVTKAQEGARLLNWLANYSHDLMEEGNFDQEAAELTRAAQWIADCLAAQSAAPVGVDLTDPIVVHANMLRGTIAKPTWDHIQHLYPEQFAAPVGGETGCICQEQHRRGYCTEPGCCFAISAPIAPQVRISEEERHAVEHARYQVEHASPDKPDCCFDYELVAALVGLADRLAALSVKPGEEVETGPVTVNEYEDSKKLEKQP